MADRLQTGATWLAEQQAAHASHAVTYTRGGVSASVAAMVGLSTWESVDAGGGILERVETRDYIIRVADLRLDGTAVEPAAGDRIAESIGSQTVTYEVMAPADEQPWRYADGYAQQYRIHTKRIDTT